MVLLWSAELCFFPYRSFFLEWVKFRYLVRHPLKFQHWSDHRLQKALGVIVIPRLFFQFSSCIYYVLLSFIFHQVNFLFVFCCRSSTGMTGNHANVLFCTKDRSHKSLFVAINFVLLFIKTLLMWFKWDSGCYALFSIGFTLVTVLKCNHRRRKHSFFFLPASFALLLQI